MLFAATLGLTFISRNKRILYFWKFIINVSETDFKRCTEAQKLSNLYVATNPNVCQQIGRKLKSFRWAKCYMILFQRCFWRGLGASHLLLGSDLIMQHLNGNGNKVRGQVRARGLGAVGGVFSNVWVEWHCCRKKADAGRFVLHSITGWLGYHLHTSWGALYVDRSNEWKRGEWGKQSEVGWQQVGKGERLLHVVFWWREGDVEVSGVLG